MVYEKTIYRIKGQFDGIYRWGVGFITHHQMRKWELFWSIQQKIYWTCFTKDYGYGNPTHYLVSTYGSCYLHPDCFNLVLENPSEGVLRELHEICEECAKECDGTFTMEYTTHTIVIDDTKTQTYKK